MKNKIFTPRNILLPESNPAAYILAVYGGLRSTNIRHANLDMVDWATLSPSFLWLPAIVSMTTKSIWSSDDLPI